ncbi:MAG: alpha/beta hydrolase [Planctomycetaceae bacterium]|nr:alpha/beta hydrolase [Planctomycetaceae bacterium]
MSLDPQAEAFLQRLAEDHTPPIHELSIEQIRSMVLPIAGEPERVGGVISDHVTSDGGEIPVRIFTPLIQTAELDAMDEPEEGRPMIVFFHGGGWVTGSIETHEAVCRRMANEGRCLVIAVDYRLAPEHKFPAAVDDAFASVQWAVGKAEHLGGDPQRLYVCGDSAGGNLAAAVCLKARDGGGPDIRGQILIYPITNDQFDTDSYRDNATGYHLTTENMRWFWQQYLANESEGEDPLASPLKATDHSNLPDALIITVEKDPLRDEGVAYADRLSAAGCLVDQIHCTGMVHGFFRRLDTFDRAGRLVEEIAQWIHENG